MHKLSKLFLAAIMTTSASIAHAVEVDVQTLASKRFSIQAEVSKDGKVVSSSTQQVNNGGTAHFTDAKFKEIDTNVTVNCRTGLKRWLELWKSRCDEPEREVSKVAIGFNAKITAREFTNGNISINLKGSYVDVISEFDLEGVEANLRVASFRDSSLNSNMIVKPGQVFEITSIGTGGEIRLKLIATQL